jgi:hypothetical protein
VLGGPAGVELQLGLELADAPLAVAQQLQDPHPRGVAEHAEELRLRDIDGLLAGGPLSHAPLPGDGRAARWSRPDGRP